MAYVCATTVRLTLCCTDLQTGQLQGSSVGATLLRIHREEGAVALFR